MSREGNVDYDSWLYHTGGGIRKNNTGNAFMKWTKLVMCKMLRAYEQCKYKQWEAWQDGLIAIVTQALYRKEKDLSS